MNYNQFSDSSGSNLHEIKEDLYVEFTNATNNTSKRYRISEITTDLKATNATDAKKKAEQEKDDLDVLFAPKKKW